MMEPGKCVQLANLFIAGSAIGNVELSSYLQCFTDKSDLSLYIKGRLEEKGATHVFLECVDSLSVDSAVFHQGWFYSICTVRPSQCVLGYHRLQSCLSHFFSVVGYMTDYQCLFMNLSSAHKMALRLNVPLKDGIICIVKSHHPCHTDSQCNQPSVILSTNELKRPKPVCLSAESLCLNFNQQRDRLLEQAEHTSRSADSKIDNSVNRDKTIHNKASSILSPNRKRHKSDGTSLLGKSPLLDMINSKIRKRHRTSSNVSNDTGQRMEIDSESEGQVVAKVMDKNEKKKEVTRTHSDSQHSKIKTQIDKQRESKISSSKKHSSKHSKENKKVKEQVASPKKSLKVSLMEKLESSLMGGKKKSREKCEGKTKQVEKHNKKSSKSSKSSTKAHHQHEAEQVFSSVFTSTGLTKQLGRIPKKAKPASEVASPAISDCIEQSDNSQDIAAADKVVDQRVTATLDNGKATLDDGAATLDDGTATLDDGIATLDDGPDTENIPLPSERGDGLELFENINMGLDIKSMVADALYQGGDKSLMQGCKSPAIPGLGDFNELELLRKMEGKTWHPRSRTIRVTECDLKISFKVDKLSKQTSGSSAKADIGDILYIGLFGTTVCQSMQMEYGSLHECVSMLHDISTDSISTSIWNKSVIQDGQQMYKITLSKTVKSVNTSFITKDIMTNKGMQSNFKPDPRLSDNISGPTTKHQSVKPAADKLIMVPVEQILDYSDDEDDVGYMNMYTGNHRNVEDFGLTVKDLDLPTDELNHAIVQEDQRKVISSKDCVGSIKAESDGGLAEGKHIISGTDLSLPSNDKTDTIKDVTGNSMTSNVAEGNATAEVGGYNDGIRKKSSPFVLNQVMNDLAVCGDDRRIVLKLTNSKPSDIIRKGSNESNDNSGENKEASATTNAQGDSQRKSRKRTRWDDLSDKSQNISSNGEAEVNPRTTSNLIDVPITGVKKSSSDDKSKNDTRKESLQVELESNENMNELSKNQSKNLTENRSRKSSSPEEQENTSRKISSRDMSDNKARKSSSRDEPESRSRKNSSRDESESRAKKSSSRDESESRVRKNSSRDESESRAKKSSSRDESESRSRKSSARDEPENRPSRSIEKCSNESKEKSERSADVTAFLQKLSTTSEVVIDIDKGKRNERAEKRRNRQYHPYKKGRSGHHTPHWSFDLAYSDMNELLQNLTENTYKCQGHVPVEVPSRSRRRYSGRSNGRQGRFGSYSFIRSTVYRTPPREDSSSEDEFDLKDIPELKTRAKQADLLEEKFSTGKDEGEYSKEMQIYEKDTTKELSGKKGKLGPPLVVPGGPKTSTYSRVDLSEDSNDADELAFGLRSKSVQDGGKEPRFYSYSLKLIKDTLNNVKIESRSRHNSGASQSGQTDGRSRHSSGTSKDVQADSRSRQNSPTRKDTQAERMSRHNSPTCKDIQAESRSRHNSVTNKDTQSKTNTNTQTAGKTGKDQEETSQRSEAKLQEHEVNRPRSEANTIRSEEKCVNKKQDMHTPKKDLKDEFKHHFKNKLSEKTDISEMSDDQVTPINTRDRGGEQKDADSGNSKVEQATSDPKRVYSTNILPSDSEECLDWSDEDETLDKDGSQLNESFNEMVKSKLKNCYVVVDSLEESEIGDMTNKSSFGRDSDNNNGNHVKTVTEPTCGTDEFINLDNECMVTIDVCDTDTDVEGGPSKLNDGIVDNSHEQNSNKVQDGDVMTTVVEQKSVNDPCNFVESEHKESGGKEMVENSGKSESHFESKQGAYVVLENSNLNGLSTNAGTDFPLKHKASVECSPNAKRADGKANSSEKSMLSVSQASTVTVSEPNSSMCKTVIHSKHACKPEMLDDNFDNMLHCSTADNTSVNTKQNIEKEQANLTSSSNSEHEDGDKDSQISDDSCIMENLPDKTDNKETTVSSQQCNKVDRSSNKNGQNVNVDLSDESESVDDDSRNDLVSHEVSCQEETHYSASLDQPVTVDAHENSSGCDNQSGEDSRKVVCLDADRCPEEIDRFENADVDELQNYRIDEMVVIEELEQSSMSSTMNENNDECDTSSTEESVDDDHKNVTDTAEKDQCSSDDSLHTVVDINENVEQSVDDGDMHETSYKSLDNDIKDKNNNSDDYEINHENLCASEESELSDGFSSVNEMAAECNMVNKESPDKQNKQVHTTTGWNHGEVSEEIVPKNTTQSSNVSQNATESSNGLVAQKSPSKFVSQLHDDSVVVVEDVFIQDESDTIVPASVPTSTQNEEDVSSKQETYQAKMVNSAQLDSSTCPNLNINSTSAMCDTYGNLQGNDYNHSWVYNAHTAMPSPYYASPMNQYPWQQFQGNYLNPGQGHPYADMNSGMWTPNNAFSPYMTPPNYYVAHNTPGLPMEQMSQPMWNPYGGFYPSPTSSAYAAAPWIMSPGHMTSYMPGRNPNTFFVTEAARRSRADSISPSRKCDKIPKSNNTPERNNPVRNQNLDINVSEIPLPSSTPLLKPESLSTLCSKYVKPAGIKWRGKSGDSHTTEEHGEDDTITNQSESCKRRHNVETLKVLSKKCYNDVLSRKSEYGSALRECGDQKKMCDKIMCTEKSDNIQSVISLKEMCRNMLTKAMEDQLRYPSNENQLNNKDNLKCPADEDLENNVKDVLNDIILNIENHDSIQIESKEHNTRIQSCQVVPKCSSVNETKDLMKVTVECTITHQEHAIHFGESDSQRLGDTGGNATENLSCLDSKILSSPEKQHAGCQNVSRNVEPINETSNMDEELKLFYESIQEMGKGPVKEAKKEIANASIETVLVDDLGDTSAEIVKDKNVGDAPEINELSADLEDDFIPCTPENNEYACDSGIDSEDVHYDGQKNLAAIAAAYLEPDDINNEEMNTKANCNISHEEGDSKRQGVTCRTDANETKEHATPESKNHSSAEQQHACYENSNHNESSDKTNNVDKELKLFYESINEIGTDPVIEVKEETADASIKVGSVNGLGNNNVEPIKDAPEINKLSAGLEDELTPCDPVNDKCTIASGFDSADVHYDCQNSLASIATAYLEREDIYSEQMNTNELVKDIEDTAEMDKFSTGHEDELIPNASLNDILAVNSGIYSADVHYDSIVSVATADLEHEESETKATHTDEVLKLSFKTIKEIEESTEEVARASIETGSVNSLMDGNVKPDVEIDDVEDINKLSACLQDELIPIDSVYDKCAGDSGIDSEVVHHDGQSSLATISTAYSESEDIAICSETCNESATSVVKGDVNTNSEHVNVENSMDRGEKNSSETLIVDSKPPYTCGADGDRIEPVISSKTLAGDVEVISRSNEDEPSFQPEENKYSDVQNAEGGRVLSTVYVEKNNVTGFENRPTEQIDEIDEQMKLFYASIQSEEDVDKEICEFSGSCNVSDTQVVDEGLEQGIESMCVKSSLPPEIGHMTSITHNLLSDEAEPVKEAEDFEKHTDDKCLIVSQESSDTEDDLVHADFEIDDVECETIPQDAVKDQSKCYLSSDDASRPIECNMVSAGMSDESLLYSDVKCEVEKITEVNFHEDDALDNVHDDHVLYKHADSLNFLSMAYAEADNSNIEIPLEVETSIGTETSRLSPSDEVSLLSRDDVRKAVLKSPKTEVDDVLKCKWTEHEVCTEETKQEENDSEEVDDVIADTKQEESDIEKVDEIIEDIEDKSGEKDNRASKDRPIYSDTYLKSRGIIRATDASSEFMHPTMDKRIVKADPSMNVPVNSSKQTSIQLRLQNLSNQSNSKIKKGNVCMPVVGKKQKNKGFRKALHYKVLMNASRSNSKKLAMKMEDRKSSKKEVEDRNKYVTQWLYDNETGHQYEQNVEPIPDSCSASDSSDKSSVTSALSIVSATPIARLPAACARIGVRVACSDTSQGSRSRGSSLWNTAQRSSSQDSSLSNSPTSPVLPKHSAVKQNRQYRRKSQRTSTSSSSSENATHKVRTNHPSISTRVDDYLLREKVDSCHSNRRSRKYSRSSSTSERSVSPVYFRNRQYRRSRGMKSPTDASKHTRRHQSSSKRRQSPAESDHDSYSELSEDSFKRTKSPTDKSQERSSKQIRKYRRSNDRSKSPVESISDKFPELSEDSSECSRQRNHRYHHLSARNKSPRMRSRETKTRNKMTHSSSSDRRNRSFEESAEYLENYKGQSSKDRSRHKEVRSEKQRPLKRYVESQSPIDSRSNCSSPTGEVSFRSPVRNDRQSRMEGGRKYKINPVVTDGGRKWSRSQNKYRKCNNTEVKDVRTNETKTENENDVKTVQNPFITKTRRQKKRVLMLTTMLKSMKMSDLVCILQKLIQNSSTCCHWILTFLSSQLATLEPSQCTLIETLEHKHSCLQIIHSVDNLDSYVVMELKDTNVEEIYIITEPLAQDENVRSIIKYCCMDTFLNKHLS